MEDKILELFRSWGFEAKKLKEQARQSPDFFVNDKSATFLIEFKIKEDNLQDLKAREQKLDLGELFFQSTPLVPNNRVSGVIRKAQSQLAAEEDVSADFRLVWLAAGGRDQEAKKELFLSTLYGKTGIVDLDVTGALVPCYFYHNSEFFRYRNILDGAILSWGSQAKFCLNPCSSRYADLKSTNLFGLFNQAVWDPLEEEINGLAFIVDSEIDRRNEEELIGYLKQKYSRDRLMRMDIGYHSVSVGVPDDQA